MGSGSKKRVRPPTPIPAAQDEADAAPLAEAIARRGTLGMLGYRASFLSPRGPGGPAWAEPEKPNTPRSGMPEVPQVTDESQITQEEQRQTDKFRRKAGTWKWGDE